MKNPHLNLFGGTESDQGVPNDLGLGPGVPPGVLHSIDRVFLPRDNVVS